VNALQECHDTEAAQLKLLKSALKAMKKHLPTLQDEIAMGYGLPGKDEHDNQDSKGDSGRTSLSWAAWNGHEAVVKLLLAMDIE
jgi:hypothetical protein